MIVSFGLSNTGCVRTENEDRIRLDERMGLFLVADGMGGHSHGEVAAELAASAVQAYIESSKERADVTWPFGYDFGLSLNENRLATAIRLANRQVWKKSEESPECAGMGTTVAAALVSDNKAAIANVGDSRVYVFRDGVLELLSVDDTWVSAMIRQGTIDPVQASNHPMKNVLTQAAGAREHIEVHTCEHTLVAGDLLMLTSDGLHGVVEEAVICAILEGAEHLPHAAERLIQAARDQGAPDNISCILLRYTELAEAA